MFINNIEKLMPLGVILRFSVVPLLKVILLSLVLFPFRVALKVSIFSTSLVDLVEPLYEKLFLPYSILLFYFFRLCLDSTKEKNGDNLLLKPCLQP